jgi:hypothetical protein
VNVQTRKSAGEDPSSERWLEYYREAKVRRRSRPREERHHRRVKAWRNRQRALVVGGFLTIGALVAVFSMVLAR